MIALDQAVLTHALGLQIAIEMFEAAFAAETVHLVAAIEGPALEPFAPAICAVGLVMSDRVPGFRVECHNRRKEEIVTADRAALS